MICARRLCRVNRRNEMERVCMDVIVFVFFPMAMKERGLQLVGSLPQLADGVQLGLGVTVQGGARRRNATREWRGCLVARWCKGCC